MIASRLDKLKINYLSTKLIHKKSVSYQTYMVGSTEGCGLSRIVDSLDTDSHDTKVNIQLVSPIRE